MNGDDWPDYVIPAPWWKERDVLRGTHAWATGRFVPPEIMLTHVLAELTLRTPTTVVLPPIIGGPAALNFGGTIVAETGVGKTAGGRGLLHSATGRRPTGTSWPLGSGEGLVEMLVDSDENGDKVPHGRPVLIHADEGRALEELIARSGSTLISTLCSAISGAEIGQTNATRGLRRRAPALEYRLAVVLNVQPVYLKGVLADIDGGLPQRFLFMSGTGHHLHADAVEPPTPLVLPDLDVAMFTARAGTRPAIAVPEAIRSTIVTEHVARLRRLDAGEPVAGGSHRNLLRLRLAALLALAEGRSAVNDDDWELAVVPVDASDATIARGEALRAAEAAQRARAETERAARHAVASDVAVELDRVERLAVKVTGWVRAEPGTSRRSVARRLSAASYPLLDEAIDHAIATGRIIESAEPSHTSDDKRALYPAEERP